MRARATRKLYFFLWGELTGSRVGYFFTLGVLFLQVEGNGQAGAKPFFRDKWPIWPDSMPHDPIHPNSGWVKGGGVVVVLGGCFFQLQEGYGLNSGRNMLQSPLGLIGVGSFRP